MIVQRVRTNDGGYRYLLLDDAYRVIEHVHSFLKFMDVCGRAVNTQKSYCYGLKLYFEYLREIEWAYDEICSHPTKSGFDILADFMGWLGCPNYLNDCVLYLTPPRPKRSDATINLIMSAVCSFYDYLSRSYGIPVPDSHQLVKGNSHYRGFLRGLVATRTRVRTIVFSRRTVEPEVKAITRDQYKQLVGACTCLRDRLLIAVLFEGGLRIGEALGLHLEDVEVWNNLVKIVPRDNPENGARVKNQAAGSVFMAPSVMKLFSDYLTQEYIESASGFVFVNLHGPNRGHPMRYITVAKLFERLGRKTGLVVHAHMCRHGHATELMEEGFSEVEIMDRLRHRQVQSTIRYISLSDEYKKKKLAAFYSKQEVRQHENN